MRILILGNGGRESAFAWKLSAEISKDNIFIAPGNAGTSAYGTNVTLDIFDFKGIGNFCLNSGITILLPGSEGPLVAGIRNYFEGNETLRHILVFGPDKIGAMLEGSKEFAKQFMIRHGIPTAQYRSFKKGEERAAWDYLDQMKPPYVIKADGLAAGKGVIIPHTISDAKDCINEILVNDQFGEAGATVVIEEFLTGIEVSFFVMTDGVDYILMPEAKDYKRIGDNDSGPNTGGMGAVSPVPFVNDAFRNKVIKTVIEPTLEGLKKENILYRGFIFFGLMNVNGDPMVIEYNCRMGDPETEVVLPRMKNNLSDIMNACTTHTFQMIKPEIDPRFCCTVMLVSAGYPGEYTKGKTITVTNPGESLIFHAGTKQSDTALITDGGRVMAVTSYGTTMDDALKSSYSTINTINFEGMYYRKDIGNDLRS